MRPWRPLALCLLLAACGPAAPGAGPGPVQTDAITTSALETPAVAGSTTQAVATGSPVDLDVPIAAIAALPGPAALDAAGPDTLPDPAANTEPTTAPETDPPAPVAEPAPAPSVAEVACTSRGGVYSSTPDGGVRACVRRTRDGGEQCRKATDCQGECLARSRTCAPIDPLLGCNEILQDNGARVTLCLD